MCNHRLYVRPVLSHLWSSSNAIMVFTQTGSTSSSQNFNDCGASERSFEEWTLDITALAGDQSVHITAISSTEDITLVANTSPCVSSDTGAVGAQEEMDFTASAVGAINIQVFTVADGTTGVESCDLTVQSPNTLTLNPANSGSCTTGNPPSC